jgi:protein-tyrosine-phosphatase
LAHERGGALLAPLVAVFVCTGNTCRSPLAMALARQRWPDLEIHSAGLQAETGLPAANHAHLAAVERGVDLSTHRSRALDAALVARADWIIGMTRSHVAQLNAGLGDDARVRIGLLGHPNEDLAGKPTPAEEEVADPFGSSLETYRTVTDQIARLLAAWDDTFGRGAPAPGGPS